MQLFAELSSLRGVGSQYGSSTDESYVLRRMCGSQSHNGVDVYCTSQSQILYVLEYMTQIKNFHHILPSEQVTSLPRLFCPTEEKSITINLVTNGD